MQTTKHVEYLQIGGAADGDPRATSITGLAVGEIGVFTSEGVMMTEATAATSAGNRFVIATKLADGTIVRSPEYSKADIKSCTRKVYTAGTVQTDYVGYNGTTGSIDVINDNSYKINLQVQELLRSNSDGRKVKFGIYKSSSSATQAEIASALTKSLFQNFEREAEKFIKFYMLTDNAGTEAAGASDTFVGNAGSTKVVVTEVGGVLPYLFVAGDYIRFGTATTDPVYKIVSTTVTVADGGTLTLDMPLQDAVSTSGTGAVEYITAANMATANCGIKMVGQALSFKAGKFNDEVVMWETQLVDFEDTTTTFKSTAATRGSGTVNQLKQMEWMLQGFEGEYSREKFSETFTPRTNTNASVLGGGYDLIRIAFETKNTVGFQNNISHQAITLAVPTDASTALYAIAATTDDITDVLEVLAFGSDTGALAIS
jgi:hypothetical protein